MRSIYFSPILTAPSLSLALSMALAVATVSTQASAQSWGSGVYGANQSCPYGGGMGGGMQQGQQPPEAPEEDRELKHLQNEQKDARRDKRDAQRKVEELERKKTEYADAISAALKPDWADAVTSHLDDGGECGCEQPEPPPQEIPVVEPPPREHHSHGLSPTVSDAGQPTDGVVRAPASETENQYDRSWAEAAAQQSYGGCANTDALHASKPWRAICTRGWSHEERLSQSFLCGRRKQWREYSRLRRCNLRLPQARSGLR